MATEVRRDASRFGKPNDGRANNRALSSIQAEGAHGQRIDTLQKRERTLRRRAKSAGATLAGSADAATNFGEASQGASAALQRQADSIRELQRRQQRAVVASKPDFIKRYPGYANLPTKTQEKRWRNWQAQLAESVSLRSATKAFNAAQARLNGRTVRANSLMADYNRYRKRATRIQRQYVQANTRLRNASRVVRWTP